MYVGDHLLAHVHVQLRDGRECTVTLDSLMITGRIAAREIRPELQWFDSEFGADNVYAWAKEQAGEVSHQMFGSWMHRNSLSLNTAAAALGISRRMVSYYRTAHKAIPRAIWLACLGWEATLPKAKTLPRKLPTAREYAKAHG